MTRKILSIDDSKMVHLVVSKTLKPFAVTLLTASNGEEGYAKARQDKPDLILLDITMPVMDGIETLAKLREDQETQAIPVLMLSADSAKDRVERAKELGASHFLAKPFTAEGLLTALGSHITLAQAGQG